MGIFKDIFKVDKVDKEQAKRDMYKYYLNSGMDRVAAYQMAYKVNYEQAVAAISEDNYKYLIDAGLSEEEARKMAFRENLENSNKKK